jgi:glycosyltransferase involved in cell wall biosynthesis
MSQPIRVLFLTQYFPPETGAPQVRLFEMAKWLVRNGFEVEVLTALPNYPQGRIYDGYRRKLYVVESREGMRIIRAPILPSRSAGLVRRLANYFSFVFSSMLLGLLLARRPSVIICESPPLFLGLSALFLKVMKRCRLIFNVSDLWPETAVRMGMHNRPVFVWLARKLERLCYRRSEAATGQSAGIVRGIRDHKPQGIVELIPNGCDCEMFHPRKRSSEFRKKYDIDERLVVGYAGLVGLAQGVEVVIEVAERLRDDDRIRFVVAGDGPERERIESELKDRRLPNVIFTGWLSKDAMPQTVASFDMAFIPLRCFIPGALPSKVYEAMASEIPIVLAALGDPRELIERANAGLVVRYEDIDGIVGAICHLADHPSERQRLGRNGRQYVLQHHQRHAIAAKLGEVIEAVTVGDPRKLRRAA